MDSTLGNFLWIPARLVIYLAIIVVGTRLGIITNSKKVIFKFNENIKYSLFLKLFILPIFIYGLCQILNFEIMETTALVLQAGTPSAISTILLAEAYKRQRELAAKTLFITTIVSTATIPVLYILINS